MNGAWIYSTDKGKLIVGKNVYIGRNFKAILGSEDIVIGDNVNIGDNVTLATQLHSKSCAEGYKNLPSFSLGNNSLIASCCFVYTSVEANSRVAIVSDRSP